MAGDNKEVLGMVSLANSAFNVEPVETEEEIQEPQEQILEPIESEESLEIETEEIEEELEEESEETEEDESEEESEEDLSEYTAAQLFAMDYMEQGVLPDDFDVENVDPVALSDAILKSSVEKAELIAEQKAAEKFASDPHKEYIDLLFNGSSDEEIVRVRVLDQLASANYNSGNEEQDEKVMEHLLVQYYRAKGLNDKRVQSTVEDIFENGDEEKEVKEAQKFFASESKGIKETRAKEKQERDEELANQREELKKTVVDAIDSGEIGNSKITDADKIKLKKALFENTKVVKINGQQQIIPEYQAILMEIDQDPIKQLELAKFLILDEGDVEKIKAPAEEKAKRQLLNHLKGKKVPVKKKGNRRKSKPQRNIEVLGVWDA